MALIALLDANVLWPQALRDTLIRAAIWDLYRPAWTLQILDEMSRSLVRAGRVERTRIDRTVQLMRENCPHFLVEGYEGLIPEMRNNEKDRHVLAAAVRVQANTIVTSNTRHFPSAARDPYGIELHT